MLTLSLALESPLGFLFPFMVCARVLVDGFTFVTLVCGIEVIGTVPYRKTEEPTMEYTLHLSSKLSREL
jgi:hypothetical protein